MSRMSAIRTLGKWLSDAGRILIPDTCVVCGNRLQAGEPHICTACLSGLPFTKMRGAAGNPVERIFWHHIPIGRANALLYYYPGSDSSEIFMALKYHNRPQIGIVMGRMMAADLLPSGFFDGIDCIVPVPLARRRLYKRGYNQSERLAQGVSQVTGIRVENHAVRRMVANPSQTSLRRYERQKNVENIFRLSHPELLKDRHVLLIDDILTTGSTLLSCALEVCKAEPQAVSILVLGLAGHHGSGPVPKSEAAADMLFS